MYGKSLSKDIKNEESGDFGKILNSISAGNREVGYRVNAELARKEAEELYAVFNVFDIKI